MPATEIVRTDVTSARRMPGPTVQNCRSGDRVPRHRQTRQAVVSPAVPLREDRIRRRCQTRQADVSPAVPLLEERICRPHLQILRAVVSPAIHRREDRRRDL